jgi:hypothetical protein
MKKNLCNTSRIGRYGRMRLEFIKKERQELYTQLLFSAGLDEYLIDINDRVKESIWDLTQKLARRQGITEELKASDQMAWVRAMNAIKAQAEEIILETIVYA